MEIVHKYNKTPEGRKVACDTGPLDSFSWWEISYVWRGVTCLACKAKKPRLKTYDGLEPFEIAKKFFGSRNKASLWFRTPNPLLGGLRPSEMIKMGREKKLINFMKNCIRGNHP
jgi:hypothetical protein